MIDNNNPINYKDLFFNHEVTEQTIFEAIRSGATNDDLLHLTDIMNADRKQLNNGAWLDLNKCVVIKDVSNYFLPNRLLKTSKGAIIYEYGELIKNVGISSIVKCYRIATKEDIATFKDCKNTNIKDGFQQDKEI